MTESQKFYVSVNGRTILLSAADDDGTVDSARYCAPKSVGQIRTENRLGIFSADHVCAAAFLYAVQSGESGHAVVMAESCGTTAPIPVVADMKTGHVTVCPPIPVVHDPADGVRRMDFPGLRCYVGTQISNVPDAETPVMLVRRSADCSMVNVQLCLSHGAPLIELPASGIAAAAAVIDYASTFPNGVSECGVGMPGGELEVGVKVEDGAVLGLSVCSVLRLLKGEEVSDGHM